MRRRRIQGSMDSKVTRNEQRQRFEMAAEGQTAILEYRQSGNRLALTHTEVPEGMSGKGRGSALVRFALDYAREHRLHVAPDCPFVARFIERHREYKDLVAA